jgi:hypothetical protein
MLQHATVLFFNRQLLPIEAIEKSDAGEISAAAPGGDRRASVQKPRAIAESKAVSAAKSDISGEFFLSWGKEGDTAAGVVAQFWKNDLS